MILWREKWKAVAIHFAATLLLAAAAAAVIFGLWFPDPFDKLVGGQELFFLVVGCDLALGPLISLVIYNSRKSRKDLLFDYSVVGAVQLAALVYGLWVVAGARPAYVIFAVDRLEVVAAGDIRPSELAAATKPDYRSLPWTGPRFVALSIPPAEHDDALTQELAGNDSGLRPRFYAPYATALEQIRSHAGALAALQQRHPTARKLLADASAAANIPADRLGWLPISCRDIYWTVLIDRETGKPVAYVALDPY
jgi:hypothetical protein